MESPSNTPNFNRVRDSGWTKSRASQKSTKFSLNFFNSKASQKVILVVIFTLFYFKFFFRKILYLHPTINNF